MPRFGRIPKRLTGLSRPHVARLAVLMGISLVAIFALHWQSQAGPTIEESPQVANSLIPVDEIMTTTSAKGLPAGVFIASLPAGEFPDSQETHAENPPAAKNGSDISVDPRMMGGVLDKTTRISPRAYYHLVDLTLKTSPSELQRQAKTEREITLAHLATEPDKYRGKLIYLEGRLRGLVRFEATKDSTLNPSGATHLYQGDLFTPQGHPYPYVLIMPSVPEGFPVGKDLLENVTFTGFFLQLWRYQAPGRTDRVAPVLVGRMMTWTPAPNISASSSMGAYLAIAIVTLLTSFVLFIWLLNRRTGRPFRIYGGTSTDSVDPGEIKADLARLERDDAEPRHDETTGTGE